MADNPFIGQMDRVIQIIETVNSRTAAGGQTSVENVVANPFAYMKEISGSEDVEGKVRHLINRSYTIRYNEVVKLKSSQLIVKDGDLVFNIIHVKDLGRKKHLEIMVKLYE
jgi:head-tail adaptor